MFPIGDTFDLEVDKSNAARVAVVLFPSEPLTEKSGFSFSFKKSSKSENAATPALHMLESSFLYRLTDGDRKRIFSSGFSKARQPSRILSGFIPRGISSRLIGASERKMTFIPFGKSERIARFDFPSPKKPTHSVFLKKSAKTVVVIKITFYYSIFFCPSQ